MSSGIRWSGISVIGREVSRTVFTVLLARIIGPDAFGIVAQALVYIGLVGLLLDQGFSSALIQRVHVEPNMPGAVVTVNLVVGLVLTGLTVAIAPVWASFMDSPELTLVLVVLAPVLLIRSAAITPRALLLRNMEFRKIGIADISAAMVGGILGAAVALSGGSYWALVAQMVATDAVLVVMLTAVGAGRWPNLHLRYLREIAPFSVRAFSAGLLTTSVSRNIDNLLIGRLQGAEALAFYGLAYRLLLLPVQLACTTVGAVLFPLFSRLSDDLAALRAEMARTTRTLAVLTVPAMALVAAAAPQLVSLLFGPQWMPAVPIVQVLAMAGAVQAVYQPSTTPIVLGLGRASLNLRYAWLTTLVSTVGIVAGLPWGPLTVAVGYTAATVLLVPVEWLLRRHLLHMTLRSQIVSLVPGAHTAVWVAAAYLVVAISIPGHDALVLLFGATASIAAGLAVLHFAHRSQLMELVRMVGRVIGRGGVDQSVAPPESTASPADGAERPPPEASTHHGARR
nr:lipopolysaccharide biosynthesis protein [Rhodococcus aetherivorans]